MSLTALDMVSNAQATLGWAFTCEGVIYTNMDVGVPGVKDRLGGAPVITTEVGQPFSPPVRRSIGAQRLIGTNMAPLTDEWAKSFKNKPYTYEVFGTINERLHNEQTISFENRLPFISGYTDGKRGSIKEFIIDLTIDGRALSTDVLIETTSYGAEAVSADFDFSQVSSTLVRSTAGEIGVDVSIASASAAAADITLAFGETLADIDLSLLATGAGTVHSAFDFEVVSSTQIRSTAGLDITMTLSDINSHTQTLTIDWGVRVDSMKWLFRSFNPETPDAWSIAPIDTDPLLPNDDNSVLEWSFPGGATSLTFTISPLQIPGRIEPDSAGRPYIPGVKLWPLEFVESREVATGLSFDALPDVAPSAANGMGDYSWSGKSLDALVLSANFPGTSGSNLLQVTAADNQVTIGNDTSSLVIDINRLFEDSAADPAKIRLRPMVLGQRLNNVTPEPLGGVEYDLGPNCRTVHQVRNDGAIITNQAATIFDLFQNDDNGVVSWIFTDRGFNQIALFDPDADQINYGILRVSGVVGEITADVSSDERSLADVINLTAAAAGTTAAVADDIAGDAVAHYLPGDQQLDFFGLLGQLLTPMDVVHYYDLSGTLIVQDRVRIDGQYDQVLEFGADIIPDTFKPGKELPLRHEFVVGYGVNWTQQPDLPSYKNPAKKVRDNDDAIKYSNHPTNTILSGSMRRSVTTCLTTTGTANRVLAKRTSEALLHFPLEFYASNLTFQIFVNTRILINGSFLAAGTFVPLRVAHVPERKESLIQGIYYVHA